MYYIVIYFSFIHYMLQFQTAAELLWQKEILILSTAGSCYISPLMLTGLLLQLSQQTWYFVK